MATILNIEEKYEGSSLTASEFNAVVTAINENATSLEEVYNEITGNLKITEIVVQASPREVYTIDSVEALIDYLKLYGTATPINNTAPIIRLKRNTYIYKEIDSLDFDIELYDLEGGDLKLIGENPLVTGGYNTFVIEGLRSGVNTINLNELVYRNTSDKLPIGIYDFKNIYVVDKLNRSSITPINIKIIIGSIELTSAFDSGVSYPKNTGIGIRYFASSVINTVSITYRLSGKYLTLNESGEYEMQTYPEKVDKLEGQKLIALDENFVVGNQYSVIRTLDAFSNIGDYTLTIQIQGEGEYSEAVSNLLSINVVVNENGFLYSSSNFDTYQQYYAGDSVDIPVNIYYTEHPDVDYLYQVEAWIDNLDISVTSNETSQQKNIPIKLVLPDDADTYTVKYRSTIVSPLGEVYKTNTNFVVIPAKQKSKYAVVTDPSSKLELYLTAKGKSNSQDNYTLWNNRYNLDQNYYGLLYNINPDTMGWEERLTNNQHKGDALYTNSIAYANINYYPFQNFTNNSTGLTVDFSIRHENAVGPDLFNLSIGNPEITPKKGIFVRDNKVEVVVGSEMDISVPVICERRILSKRSGNWEDGDEYAHITITFNTANKQVYIYLNGVISGYGEYATNSTLDHSFPIIIGAALNAGGLPTGYADTKIRFIRVYKSVLTPIQVVNNYIASFPSDDDRIFLEKLNDEISPVLSTSYMKGNRAGLVKDDPRLLEFSFIPGVEEEISSTYIPEPLAVGNYSQEYMDMKLPFPIDVDLQGNSSLSYPVNNYGIDIYDAEAYSATGSLVSKDYTMVYNELANNEKEYPWPKWDSYHLKANYIDSSHCNNLIMAKLSEQVFRFPYNWVNGSTLEYSSIFPGYVGSFPFKTFTTADNNGVSDPKSRFPVYPYRLSVDGFPFIMYGDFRNANSQLFEKRFIGLYTWNLKQHRKLYSMKKESEDPNRRYFIYRCESNGDSVHEQLRSGYCKFIDMTKQTLLVDSYDRILSPTYIYSQEEIEMLGRYPYDTFSWYPIISESGYLQPNGQYTWIKFATSIEGNNIGNDPSGKSFIGYAFNKDTSIKSNNPLDYTWSLTTIYNSIDNLNGTHSIIRYSALSSGENMSSNIDGKNFIGFKYDAIKNYWQEGVDYFDKTGDPNEMKWRAGAELIMDWECREPDDLGVGHWEEFVNGEWIKTLNIISPRDLDVNSTAPDKILRFVWDRINSSGDATRKGATRVDWWPSILNSNLSIPSRDNPGGTIIPVDKIKGETATELHVDFLNAINWLSNATDEAFSKPEIFEKYFDLRTSLDYVLCCLTFALTDSIGRNLTMIAWDQDSNKIAPGIMDRKPMRFYPVFYDIDTAFGTNVQGGLYSRPDFDWPYVIGMGEQTYTPPPNGGQEYNCFGSQFFERISKNYGRALARRYAELRSGGTTGSSINLNAPFDYNNILRLYNNQMVGRIGERYFNEDAVYKYIGYGTDDPDIVAKRNYITNARGNKVMFMKNFLKRRLNFIDAMLGYFPDTDDMAYFQHYHQGLVTLRLESSTSTTIRISFAQNNSRSISLKAGEITEVQFTYSDTTQHIMRIYNCATITRLEGLNGIDLRVARMNSLLSVRELDLRNNPAIGSIDANNGIIVSDCLSLETLNISGCNGPTPFSINLDKCYQLKNFIATNSSLSQVSLSGKYNVESIDVRNCPNLLDLSVSGLQKLTDLKLDHEVLTSLNLSQSKIFLDLSLPNLFPNLTTLNIVENSGFVTLKFDPTSFPKLSNLIIRNCSKLEVVEDLFMDRLNPVVLNAEFLANCPKLWCIKNLFKNSLIQTIPSRMLENSTDRLTCMTSVFQGCTSLVTIPEAVFSREFPLLEDITDIFNGARLQRYVDKFITVLGNPLKIGLDPINVFQSNNVFNNAPALKNITRAFYGAELVNVPVNLFQNSTLLETIDECFSNINNIVGNAPNGRSSTWLNGLLIPENLFTFSRSIKYADKVFKNTTIARVKTTNNTTDVSIISDSIFQSHLVLETAKELFKDSNLSKIPTNIFGIGYDSESNEYPSQIKYLNEAFANTDITQVPEGMLSNCPELLSISNIFYNTQLTELSSNFLANSFKVHNIENLFRGGIVDVPDNFGLNNTGITSFIGIFGPNIKTIGNNVFKGATGLGSLDFALYNQEFLTHVGEGFLENSSATSANYLFQGCSSLISVGENFAKNSKITSANSCFKSCSSLTNVAKTLFEGNYITSVKSMFEGCYDLIGDLGDLGIQNYFKNCPNITNFDSTFYNCSTLDSVTPTRGTNKLWEILGINGKDCFLGCINLKDYSDLVYGGPIPLLWGGPVTTTLNITSSQAQAIGTTDIVITEGYNYEKITNTQYKIYAPSNTTLNITITDTEGMHTPLTTQISVWTLNQTVSRQLTYIPLRSIYVKIYSLGTAIEGASVIINGTTYTTDVNGLVSVRTGGAFTASASKDSNYNTINATYDPSLINTSNNIFLRQAKSILFTVYNGSTSAGLEGATIYFPEVPGQSTELTATTNSSGQVSVVRFIGDTYTYKVSKTGFYYKETYNFTVTSDTNTAQVTLNEDWASRKPDNPYGRIQIRINFTGTNGIIKYGATSPIYVNWGDGSAPEYFTNTGPSIWKNHNYSSVGEYEIEVWSATNMKSITMLTAGNPELVAYWDIGDSNVTFESTFFKYLPEVKYVGDVFKNSTVTSFEKAFEKCGRLLSVHPDLFSHHPEVTSFRGVFEDCLNLIEIPPTLFANNTSAADFDYAFYRCHSLTSIPEGLFAATNLSTAVNIFAEAYSLRTIPNNLFSGFPELTNLANAFLVSVNKSSSYPGTPQSSLVQFPTTLITGSPVINVSRMFRLANEIPNTTLVGPVTDLWTSSLPGINSSRCFEGWFNASNYNMIPIGWK